MLWVIALLGSALIGWLPTGRLLKKLYQGRKLNLSGFEEDSLLRLLKEGGPEAVFLVMATDLGKGYAIVVAAQKLTGSPVLAMVCGLLAVAASFFGGNGKALLVAAGMVLAACLPAGQTGAAVWLAALLLARSPVIAALLAVWSVPVWIGFFGGSLGEILVALLLGLLMVYQYYDDLLSLWRGKREIVKWEKVMKKRKSTFTCL